MKVSILIILFFGLVALSTCIPQNGQQEHEVVKREASKEDRKSFKKWMKKHHKRYGSKEKEQAAMEKWLVNKKSCDDHNKLHDQGKASYRRGLSEHADLTTQEMKKLLTGLRIPYEEKSGRAKRGVPDKKDFPKGPKSVDWKHLLGPVENQDQCGSCWAFSAAGVINAQLRKNNITTLVSPQQLVDCNTDNNGCGGGWPPHAVDYAASNGMTDEEEYPYVAYQGQCDYTKDEEVATIKKSVTIRTNGDEEWLKNVIAKVGPVGVLLCVDDSFQSYQEGVYKQENCCTQVDHAIIAYGYGTDPKEGDYWLVKNQWGPTWGMGGYGKFARNNNNMCNIAYYGLYSV